MCQRRLESDVAKEAKKKDQKAGQKEEMGEKRTDRVGPLRAASLAGYN